ncbi:MAG: lysostaphin resistance A-like protein [Acidobacteriota bacterium]
MSKASVKELERQASSPLQPSTTSGWGIADAAIVGVVGYAAAVLFLLSSMFVVYSIPSLHSFVRFYQLDGVYLLIGLIAGILFAGPLVMWFVRRRKFANLADSIYWQCSNRTLGWAFLAGVVSGIAYSIARGMLARRGYIPEPLAYILTFMVLTGFAQPLAEEIYFRGILFAGLAHKLGDIPSIAAVTILFCVAHPRHWFMVLPAAVLLGAMRIYTGSVKACFACHAAYNLSLALFMLPINIH